VATEHRVTHLFGDVFGKTLLSRALPSPTLLS
jgi:hypothetical protein